MHLAMLLSVNRCQPAGFHNTHRHDASLGQFACRAKPTYSSAGGGCVVSAMVLCDRCCDMQIQSQSCTCFHGLWRTGRLAPHPMQTGRMPCTRLPWPSRSSIICAIRGACQELMCIDFCEPLLWSVRYQIGSHSSEVILRLPMTVFRVFFLLRVCFSPATVLAGEGQTEWCEHELGSSTNLRDKLIKRNHC